MDELTRGLMALARADLARRERRRAALRARLEGLDVGPRLARIRTRLAVARERLARAVTDGHAVRRRRLAAGGEQLARAMRDRHGAARQRLETSAAKLDSLSPLAVLARGYAVCWNDDRTAIVRRSAEVEIGDPVRITLHDGALRCDVTARE